jgi:hypothetical protein
VYAPRAQNAATSSTARISNDVMNASTPSA